MFKKTFFSTTCHFTRSIYIKNVKIIFICIPNLSGWAFCLLLYSNSNGVVLLDGYHYTVTV